MKNLMEFWESLFKIENKNWLGPEKLWLKFKFLIFPLKFSMCKEFFTLKCPIFSKFFTPKFNFKNLIKIWIKLSKLEKNYWSFPMQYWIEPCQLGCSQYSNLSVYHKCIPYHATSIFSPVHIHGQQLATLAKAQTRDSCEPYVM